MNKEQFLLELSQYLTFISPEERAQVIEEYNEKFEAAGATDEASLILKLGTPMMIAIALKRRKESGEPLTEHPVPKKPDPAPAPEPNAAAPEKSLETEAAEGEPEKSIEDAVEDAVAAAAQADISAEADEEPVPESEKKAAPAKKKVGAGAVVSCVLLSILSLIPALVIMALGAYFFIVFGNLLVVAFQSLNILNQALLLFAGALVSGGIGLVIVWLGLWTGIRLIAKQIARLRA